MPNNLIVCGGTFDHFHKGHEAFLNYVFSVGKKYLVGITSDNYVKNSKFRIQNPEFIEPFEKRKESVLEFVKKEKALNKVEIIKIEDLFGPTLSKDLVIDAIVVSQDSKDGADIINQKRKELKLAALKVFVVHPVNSEDGKLISSARIRNGEINRAGRLYVKPVWLQKDLILPKDLREEFHKPFGGLFKAITDSNILKKSLIIAVGDETSRNLNKLAVNQRLSVVDFKVARKKKFSSFLDLGFSGNEKVVFANNPAGHMTHDLFSKILDIFKFSFSKRIILKIAGEEDLAVLPLILAAPLDTVIYYGQPPLRSASYAGQAGIIKVVVTEQSKERAYDLASRLKPI